VNSDKTVLITGAAGRQGGAVIRYMLPKGWRLRALAFKVDNSTVRRLTNQGIEVVRGDLEDPASLERAVRGAYGVYSVQDFWSVGAKREVQQGKNIADAAKRAGVEHLVYSSVGGAERNSGIDHWESKWEIENHIRKLGQPATMIRPAAFMENYYIDQVEIGILKGKLLDPIRDRLRIEGGWHTFAFTSQSCPEGNRRTPQRALVSLSWATRGGGERT
jgi:uncharacterized protein YbjT (DUF2867 family)